MATVRRAYRGDTGCMRRRGQPVEDCGTNLATSDGVIARSGVTRNQEHDAFTGNDRPRQRVVDRPPGLIEITAVQIHYPVRFHRPRAESAIPAGVQGLS